MGVAGSRLLFRFLVMRRGKVGRARGCGTSRGKARRQMVMETFSLFGWM
jgi:hypothetical protein